MEVIDILVDIDSPIEKLWGLKHGGPIYEIFYGLSCKTIRNIKDINEKMIDDKLEELKLSSSIITERQWKIRKTRALNIMDRVKDGNSLDDLPCPLEYQCFVCGQWPVNVTEVINTEENPEKSNKYGCFTCLNDKATNPGSSYWLLGSDSIGCDVLRSFVEASVDTLRIFKQRVTKYDEY